MRSQKYIVVWCAILLAAIIVAPVNACMDVVVGKDASVDGSVMTSHTADGWYDSSITLVPGQTFEEGAIADVHWNIIGEEPGPPVKIGEIPQVKQTYSYYNVGYPFMNEHQLMIGESTIAQKEELATFRGEKAIMTIEQLEVFALQRAKTAREAINVMGELAEKYGFLPSCANMGESLTIADPNEAWLFEIFSVGVLWNPESGEPGAVWAAQRIPDDHVFVMPNVSRIREIDLNNPDYFMASQNYMQVAIDQGWYDPKSGKPFIWQEAYVPKTGDWALSSMWCRIRLYLVYSAAAPSLEWDPYMSTELYPFSIKPEKKFSVQDVMALMRSTLTGTVFDMEEDPGWLVPGEDNKMEKSPFTTPFPVDDMHNLLTIPYHRPAAKYNCSYGFVSQSRSWLPDPIGGVLWFYHDNPHVSLYVPVYCSVQKFPKSWQTFDRDHFSRDSARWAFAFADDLVNRRYQDAIKDLRAVREPIEADFFMMQSAIEIAAAKAYEQDPELAKRFLTDYTNACMLRAEEAYWQLNDDLIQKYNNNKGLTP
ncbi:peptidase U34 dipeptidase [Candidatus Vecturithrix granuli]|uniref:Dipeptidase n=1 Tax=Vecturithrix granuli TaxID=1499967 RepID=A0A081C620_VECG1|nr:peptidase U34 dipeptidase [Candidatus Vecturithrix granuli]